MGCLVFCAFLSVFLAIVLITGGWNMVGLILLGAFVFGVVIVGVCFMISYFDNVLGGILDDKS